VAGNHRGRHSPRPLDTIGQALAEIADGGMVVADDTEFDRTAFTYSVELAAGTTMGSRPVPACVPLPPDRSSRLSVF